MAEVKLALHDPFISLFGVPPLARPKIKLYYSPKAPQIAIVWRNPQIRDKLVGHIQWIIAEIKIKNQFFVIVIVNVIVEKTCFSSLPTPWLKKENTNNSAFIIHYSKLICNFVSLLTPPSLADASCG